MSAGTLRRNGDPEYHGLHVYDHYATKARAMRSNKDDGRHDDDVMECDETLQNVVAAARSDNDRCDM